MLFSVNPLNWFRQSLKLDAGVVKTILPRSLIFASLGIGVAYVHVVQPTLQLNVVGSLTTNVACNLVLGLLLVFRTNAAYDRFWQGRQAWGMITVEIRNLSREIQITIPAIDQKTQQEKTDLFKLLVAFAIATKLHLRQQTITTELDQWVSPKILDQCRQASNPPLQISLWIRHFLQQLSQRHSITPIQQMIMLNQLNKMVEGLTYCERIATTPTPLAYVSFLRKLILIYCCLLPFHLVAQLNWWVGFAMMAIATVLLGVDEIGSLMDNPFGNDPTDLPLDAICDKIISNVESTKAFVAEDQRATSETTSSSHCFEVAVSSEIAFPQANSA